MYFKEHWNIVILHEYIKSFGILAPIIFIFLYLLATLSLLPAACMSFIGGYVFGFTYGLLFNVLGSSLGVMTAFLIGRYLTRDWVVARLGNKNNLLMHNVEKQGWKLVALFRLTPLVPFDALNFAFGITNIRPISYLWSSVLFMLPGVITYTYIGKLGLEIAVGKPKFLALQAVIGIFVIMALSYFLPKILNYIRRRLDIMQEEGITTIVKQ